MTNFKGRLFRGQLFAGRLFRGPVEPPASVFPGGPGQPMPARRPKSRRRDTDDDVLMFLLR